MKRTTLHVLMLLALVTILMSIASPALAGDPVPASNPLFTRYPDALILSWENGPGTELASEIDVVIDTSGPLPQSATPWDFDNYSALSAGRKVVSINIEKYEVGDTVWAHLWEAYTVNGTTIFSVPVETSYTIPPIPPRPADATSPTVTFNKATSKYVCGWGNSDAYAYASRAWISSTLPTTQTIPYGATVLTADATSTEFHVPPGVWYFNVVRTGLGGNSNVVSKKFVVPAVVHSTTTKLSGAKTGKLKHGYKLTGTVTGLQSGYHRVKLVIYRYYSGKYHSAKTVYVTLTKGKYAYTYKPTHRSKYNAKAYFLGTSTAQDTYRASSSSYKTWSVK